MKVSYVYLPSRERAALGMEEIDAVPQNGQVLIKIDYSAISAGTELANWKGLPNTNDRGDVWPRFIGYSASGVVRKVGPEVREIREGDHVTCLWGGHRSWSMMPESGVVRFDPEKVDPREAAFSNIATFSFLGIRKLRIELGECAAVAGQGLLGMIAGQLARLNGAYPVIVSDCSPERRALALKLGADFAFDPREPDFIEKVKNASGGNGPNAVVEVTGFISALQQALEYIAWEGRITLLGCTRISDKTIDYYKYVHRRGITLTGCHTMTRPGMDSQPGKWTQRDDVKTFLKFLEAGKLKILPMISEIVSPRDAEEVYRKIGSSANPPLGNVFDWRSFE